MSYLIEIRLWKAIEFLKNGNKYSKVTQNKFWMIQQNYNYIENSYLSIKTIFQAYFELKILKIMKMMLILGCKCCFHIYPNLKLTGVGHSKFLTIGNNNYFSKKSHLRTKMFFKLIPNLKISKILKIMFIFFGWKCCFKIFTNLKPRRVTQSKF